MGAALLRLLQISDSSFPTGSFGHSQGLEYAILQGWVRERKSLYEWSKDCLIQTLFPLDGRSLWQAWGLGKANAVSELRALDLELVSFRPNFPQRQAGSQTGRSLLESALRSFGISTQGLWFNPLVSSQRMEGQFPIVWAWYVSV
jgi:urease accessory protein